MFRFLLALYLVVLVLSGFQIKHPSMEELKALISGGAIMAVVVWLLKDS